MIIYNNVYPKYCLKMKNKKMPINETKDFIFENYYKRIGFSKESSCYSIKRLKKDLMLLSNKLIEKYPILIMKKNSVNHL